MSDFNCRLGNDDNSTCTQFPGGRASLMSYAEVSPMLTGLVYVVVGSYSGTPATCTSTACNSYDLAWTYTGGDILPSSSNS